MSDTHTAMSTPTVPKLEIRNVCKTFETRKSSFEALRDVSFQVEDGGFLSLIGHSGCGKSTMLNIVAGLEQATSGEVLVDGVPRYDPGADRGMVFQSYTLFPWLTVRHNVEFGLRIQGIAAAERAEIAEHYLELVGLGDRGAQWPKQLSGGQRQRVALARALANRPAVLLMDEPFAALDAETREEMHELVLRVRERERMTVLFITHDIDEAVLLSDRIGIMSARPGRIRELCTPDLPAERNAELKMSAEFFAAKRDVVTRFRSR